MEEERFRQILMWTDERTEDAPKAHRR